jgi:hypothetical protein
MFNRTWPQCRHRCRPTLSQDFRRGVEGPPSGRRCAAVHVDRGIPLTRPQCGPAELIASAPSAPGRAEQGARGDLAVLQPTLPAIRAARRSVAFVIIPREERYLESRFPSDYLHYTASVRRWLKAAAEQMHRADARERASHMPSAECRLSGSSPRRLYGDSGRLRAPDLPFASPKPAIRIGA